MSTPRPNPHSSILQYGGVSLPFVKTEKFTQEVVYDPSGVDSIYTKVTIAVGCILNECVLGQDVATWIRENRGILMQRGLQLYYMVDGKYVVPPDDNPLADTGDEVVASPQWDWNGGSFNLPQSTEGLYTDAKLGPKPIRFETRQIQGNTWMAYYEIETYIPYCPSGDGQASPYLSNRWSIDLDVDDEYFFTRTINGTLILNGQFAPGGQTQTDLITMTLMVSNFIIIPPCPNRWKRDNIKIVRSPDGLKINYQIVDKQQYVAIPNPCTKIDATYTETSGTKDFALMNVQVCEIQVTVHGGPNANYNPTGTASGDNITWNANATGHTDGLDYNKYELMKIMFQVVLSRISTPFAFNTDGNVPSSFVQNELVQYFQMKEDLFKPIVGCTVRTLRTRTFNSQIVGQTLAASSGPGAFRWTRIGSTLPLGDIVNDIAQFPQNIGNYGTFLIAANALNTTSGSALTPCDDANQQRNINIIGSTFNYYGNTNVYAATVPNSLINGGGANPNDYYQATTGKYYSNEQYHNPFTEYTIDIVYNTDQHVLQLPIAYDTLVGSTWVGSSCVFAQTGAPTTQKIVHFKGARLGNWPMAPAPSDIENGSFDGTVTGDKLMDYQLTFADSQLLQDGITRRYEIGGVYKCGLASSLQWNSGVSDTGLLPICVNPITSDVWNSNIANTSIATASAYPTTKFVSGIIGYGTAPGPGGTNAGS